MKHRSRSMTAWFLALIMALSSFITAPLPVRAEESCQIIMEGIEISSESLIMRTGEKKKLTAYLLPEGVTEETEIVWSTDDPSVVRIEEDGPEAWIVSANKTGGTAVVTASAGGFSASCQVLVTVQEPLLESVLFMQNSSGSSRYELTELNAAEHEYRLRIPEDTNVLYVRPALRDDVTGTITAHFMDLVTGEETAVDLPVDESTSLTGTSVGRIIHAYDKEPRELMLEVTGDGCTEQYYFHIVRGSFLGQVTLETEEQEPITVTPAFQKNRYEYEAHVPSTVHALKIHMTAEEPDNRYFTVNQDPAPEGDYTLPMDGEDKTLVLEAGDGVYTVPFSYVFHIYADQICKFRIHTVPETAVIAIYDKNGERIVEKAGEYPLICGETYEYTVSAPGYRTETGQILPEEDGEKTVTLKPSAEVKPEEAETEWGGYWKTEENQNIVTDRLPIKAENVRPAWKRSYGSGEISKSSISDGILVEDKICCFLGNRLMYLDKDTGEILRSAVMIKEGNGSFNKPVYGGGMIFVPLKYGYLEAFHAKTLEPLWIYHDETEGNAEAALRYDSGYLYAGFADGNLVCLSTADEDPDSPEEEKTAVWKKYDSRGYYRTGVYTGEKYLYTCSRSGRLYCLDKRTGETIQKLVLPSEQGMDPTGICYSGNRLYFGTKEGWLYNIPLTEEGLMDLERMQTFDTGGVIFGTPLVYDHRIYVGTSTKDAYGAVLAPHAMRVIEEDPETGFMKQAYKMELPYGAKGTPTLTTAYETEDGYRYLYFTTDSPCGSVYLLKDKEGSTGPGEGSGLFYEQHEVSGLGSGSILTDAEGKIYLRYDSSWIYTLEPVELCITDILCSGEDTQINEGRGINGQEKDQYILIDGREEDILLDVQTDPGIRVFINGTEGNSQKIHLKEDHAEAEIRITKGEESRTYRIHIRSRSKDASLGELKISQSPMIDILSMELEPAFSPDHTEYNASIYFSAEGYHIWPKLPEGSKASIRVFTVADPIYGVEEKELQGMYIQLEQERRLRYQVLTRDGRPGKVRIRVTAEDGRTYKDYVVALFCDNETPSFRLNKEPVLSREKDQVTIRLQADKTGYLYYLPEYECTEEGMPVPLEMQKHGRRVPLEKGDNIVTLSNIKSSGFTMYLYEMSYAQRWSTGKAMEIPVFQESSGEPVSGDLNGDGRLTNVDAGILLDLVTGGREIQNEFLKAGDLNGDGRLTNIDAGILLDRITAGSV